jgi:molybdopterin/thiamine biosynthesis adenylyltransferase
MAPTLQKLLQLEVSPPGPIVRPRRFRLSSAEDRRAIENLLQSKAGITVYDTLYTQLRDLIRTRHPSRKISRQELDTLAREHLGPIPAEEYGLWFYYPWSMRLVHLLDEDEFVELRTNRNRYKITPDEQIQLSRKIVGVVGLSVGQSVALTLAMERSFGELRLADFDVLDLSNLNRIRAGVHNLDVPKVFVAAREIAEIDPYLNVTCCSQGITEENCDTFLLKDSPLDVLVEECDSFDIKILLREQARRYRIPVVMDTSDRGMIDIERFDQEPERPLFHGLAGNIERAQLRDLTNEQKIPFVLQILGVDHLTFRLRASLVEVEQSISTWPQLGSAVAHGGAAAADVVRRICLGEPVSSGRFYVDLEELMQPAVSRREQYSHPAKFQEPLLPKRPPALELDEMHAAARALCPKKNGEAVLDPAMARAFVEDAVQAPSGANCQPWRWLGSSGELYLFHDRSLSYTPFDPDSLGGLVALGAATENIVLSTHAAGLHIACDLFPSQHCPDMVARFHFSRRSETESEKSWRDELHSMIGVRRTNRKLCPRRPIKPDDLQALTAAVTSIPTASVHWLLEEEKLEECGRLLGLEDRVLFLTESLHCSLMNEIRWTPEEVQATRDGISIESLELSPADRAGFRLCRDWSTLKLIRRIGGGSGLEKASQKAVASASAMGLITMPRIGPAAYFTGGRAVERLWLTAAERNLAIHPMTALAYMLSQQCAGGRTDVDACTQDALNRLRPRYETLFSVVPEDADIFLFRVSYAEQTSERSLRRRLEHVLVLV